MLRVFSVQRPQTWYIGFWKHSNFLQEVHGALVLEKEIKGVVEEKKDKKKIVRNEWKDKFVSWKEIIKKY